MAHATTMSLWMPSALILACMVQNAGCQNLLQVRTRYHIEDTLGDMNHTHSASIHSPLGKALSQSDAAVRALVVLTRHFKDEAQRVLELVRSPAPLFIEERVQACNLPDSFSHINSVDMTTASYGWGVLEARCTTELATDLGADVVASMRAYIAELKKVAARVVRAAGLVWPTVRTYMEFKYKGAFETCTLLHFTAFRVNGTWGINTGVTNAAMNAFKEEWRRHYLVEVLGVQGGGGGGRGKRRLRPVRFRLPRTPPARGWEPRATTLHSTFGGVPATSLFRSIMVAANNPAVVAAVAVGHDIKEQVRDATTKSNMAILFLPLLLAIVPISLFADVSTPVMVAYAAVTDVVSALPLAIKGIELMNFGNVRQIATRTWIYGGNTETDLTAGETWHATCIANQRFIVQGRIFFGLSLLLALVGGLSEIYFRNALEKRKKAMQGRRQSFEQRPQFGEYYPSCAYNFQSRQ